MASSTSHEKVPLSSQSKSNIKTRPIFRGQVRELNGTDQKPWYTAEFVCTGESTYIADYFYFCLESTIVGQAR